MSIYKANRFKFAAQNNASDEAGTNVDNLNQNIEPSSTLSQYTAIQETAKELFLAKNKDYGPSWTILRPASLTDQIYIKAARLRSIEEKATQLIPDHIEDDYLGLINYCIMALIQLKRNEFTLIDQENSILTLYVNEMEKARDLMMRKNHDYGEAWRDMRISSMTDLILMKLLRIRTIENNSGQVTVSEEIDAGYQDVINYAIFALILLREQQND